MFELDQIFFPTVQPPRPTRCWTKMLDRLTKAFKYILKKTTLNYMLPFTKQCFKGINVSRGVQMEQMLHCLRLHLTFVIQNLQTLGFEV